VKYEPKDRLRACKRVMDIRKGELCWQLEQQAVCWQEGWVVGAALFFTGCNGC